MAAAPTILDTPQLAVSGDPNDVTWLRACELRGRLTISPQSPRAFEENGAVSSMSEWLNREIETHLLSLGASPATASIDADASTYLCDQAYRARLLGYTGLALALPSLVHFSSTNGLNSSDSWALLDFCKIAAELDVELRFAAHDAQLNVVPRPVPLEQLVPSLFVATVADVTLAAAVPATSHLAPETARKPDTLMAAEEVGGPAAPRAKESGPPASGRSMRAAMQDLLNDEPANLDDVETPVPRASSWAAPKPAPRAAALTPAVNSPVTGTITPTPQPAVVLDAIPVARVEKLIRELQTTDGTCGWEEIEQRFTESYLPLQQLLPTLPEPTSALEALSQWSSAFAESYRTAFEALRSNRGKRPRLVLDVPSHAFQLSRKLESEQCKLVLVDAMRADLAPIVLDKLRVQMTHTAECVEGGLMWSALPSTTAAQMELIARGTDGLRHFTGELSEEQLLSRGNDLRRLRPVRVGSHRMYKLDIVQYLTRDATSHDHPKLEQYAAEIATSVGRFLRQQGPNTLVYVFGDHGFGGASDASPENVLVPYFAWRLLG
jgi:hypothetical protein